MLLLLSVIPVAAADMVCESSPTLGTFRRYLTLVDPPRVVVPPEEVCWTVSKANTPSQQAINVGNPYATPPVPPLVPQQYRKVVNKLVVEMTPEEKQQVDAARAAQAAVAQSYTDERADTQYCAKKLLGDITTVMDNRRETKQAADATAQTAIKQQIDSAPLDRTLLKTVVDDYYARVAADRTDEYTMMDKIARCLRSYIGAR